MKNVKLVLLIVILMSLAACGGKDGDIYITGSDPTPPVYSGATPPDGDPGTSTFIANGGNCTADGCEGGSVGEGVGYDGISIGGIGDIWITTTGSVDISVTVPTPTPVYGGNKLTISEDTVVVMSGAADTVGDIFLVTNNSNLYECLTTTCYNGGSGTPDTDYTMITGLEVKEGATLTLPKNYDSYYHSLNNWWFSAGNTASISLDNAVVINGTVKTAADGVCLSIVSDNGLEGDSRDGLIQIGTTGVVTTKSATPSTSGEKIELYSYGVTINAGTIDASGSDGTTGNGGHADYLYLYGATGFYNTGNILAKGGKSDDAAGGNGSEFRFWAYSGTLFSSGTIDVSGGNGGTTGGYAAYGNLEAGYYDDDSTGGDVLVTGLITANGGNGGTGDAGYCRSMYLRSYGGKVWSSATISLKGGSSENGYGGEGGYFSINADNISDDDGYGGAFVPSEGIQLGGHIDLSGGNGAERGGRAGNAQFSSESEQYGALPYIMTGPSVWLKGFTGIITNGGEGVARGGNGGSVMIMSQPAWMSDGGYAEREPCGAIFNQVPITAKGGNATAGTGGNGGMIVFDQMVYLSFVPDTIISNSGSIDISGGGGDIGGNSGLFTMSSLGELANSGVITAKGGTGVTTGGNGASPFNMESELFIPAGIIWSAGYDLTNTGAIDASGGTATATGGNGGELVIQAGGTIHNSVAINLNGGAATTTGGNGGKIFLVSGTPPTTNSGTLSVTGGTGATAGTIGSISID